jgi:hypothetical protein
MMPPQDKTQPPAEHTARPPVQGDPGTGTGPLAGWAHRAIQPLVRGRVRLARRQLGQGTGTDAGAVSCCRYRRQLRPSLTALTNTRTATPSISRLTTRAMTAVLSLSISARPSPHLHRFLELVGDPDPRVRGDVIHAITDSTPALRVPAVIQVLESRHNDPDVGIRRQVRKTLAHYRRTGKVTDAAR